MKCSVCGQNYKGKTCPFCGTVQGGDSGNAGEDFGDGDSFQDNFSDQMTPGSGRKGTATSGRRTFIVLAAVVLVLAISATIILLIPRNKEEVFRAAGLSAPTGHFVPVDRGVYALSNELLVIQDNEHGIRDLEKCLEPLDGAIVGYFPHLKQYQVKFNTDSLETLNEKRKNLEASAGVLRTDYNFVLNDVFSSTEDFSGLPGGQGGRIGWIGVFPTEEECEERVFYLPSNTWATLEKLRADGVLLLRTAQRVELENGRETIYASGYYPEQTADGSMTAWTTTGALRFQMARLVDAGCDIICCPAADAQALQDKYLRAEAEQMELLINALEKDHPAFLICLPYTSGGWLYQTLKGSEVGSRHALFAASCSDHPEDVLDAAGAGKPVYAAAEILAEGTLGVSATNGTEAAARLAAWAENEKTAVEENDLKEYLFQHAPALTCDDRGSVRPALDASMTSAGGQPEKTYHAVKLKAVDAVTGTEMDRTVFRSGNVKQTATKGKALLLTAQGSEMVSAEAEGYIRQEVQADTAQREIVLNLQRSVETTGTLKGKVNGSGDVQLYARLTEMQSGTVYPDRLVDANYRISVYPGEYSLTVAGNDRTPVTIYGITAEAGKETVLQDITLAVHSDLSGTSKGQVIDSMNGNPVPDAELRFYNGVNAADSGTPVLSTRSDSRGNYTAVLHGGAYTVYTSKEQYRTSWRTIFSDPENILSDQNCTLTPAVPDGQIRIALTWGAKPSDLDSHLVNVGAGIHVFFSSMQHAVNGKVMAILDHDDTQSYGPEQTTIMVQQPGTYVFYVHDYTNKNKTSFRELAESEATVTVYVGTEEPKIFHVPDQPGTLWKVFTCQNGIIVPSGEMSYESNAGQVGR